MPVKIHGLKETSERLRNLPKELAGKNGGPIRRALFQAAKVIEEQARTNAQRIDRPETETNIPQAVKKWRERNPQDYEGRPVELYHVGVDGRKAPHWHFLELGTVKQGPQPYLRPAADEKYLEAFAVFAAKLKKDVDKLEKTVR